MIKRNDADIYEYFKEEEKQQNNLPKLERLYNEFFEFDKTFDSKYDTYIQLLNGLQFVSVTTPYEQIRANLESIKPLEERLRQEIIPVLSDHIYTTEITQEIRHSLEQYASQTWVYFSGTSYFDENLNILYTAMHNYAYLLSRKYFLLKRAILTYQEELMKKPRTA